MASTFRPENVTDLMIILSADDILPEDLSAPVKLLFIILYTAIIVCALLGNTALIFVVLTNAIMRNVTNMFLVSLAISDLMVAIWNMPFQLAFYVRNEWIMGVFMCKFTRYLQGVNVVSSTFALTCIAIERYYAICHPIKTRHLRTTKKTVTSLIILWSISLSLLIPQIFLQKLQPKVKIDESQYPPVSITFICVEVFDQQYTMMTYTFFFYIVLYLLPLAIMFGTYGKIIHRLWISQPIGDALSNPHHQMRHIRQKKKIIKTLVIVVVLFAVCWFPFFTSQIYVIFHEVTGQLRIMTAFFQLIGYLNCSLNPILYAFMNDTFRRYIYSSLFHHCQRRRKDNGSVSVTIETGV